MGAFVLSSVAALACGSDDSSASNPGGTGGTATGGSAGAAGSSGSGGSAGGSGAGACPKGASGTAPSDYLTQYKAGSRLQPRLVTAPGAPQIFDGFFDTKLGVACTFRFASDDKLRCLPLDADVAVLQGFADSACEDALWEADPACKTSTGYSRKRLECRGKFAIHPLVEHVGGVVPYNGSPGNCSATGNTTPYPNLFKRGERGQPGQLRLGLDARPTRGCVAQRSGL